jgi:hypothetical protein
MPHFQEIFSSFSWAERKNHKLNSLQVDLILRRQSGASSNFRADTGISLLGYKE